MSLYVCAWKPERARKAVWGTHDSSFKDLLWCYYLPWAFDKAKGIRQCEEGQLGGMKRRQTEGDEEEEERSSSGHSRRRYGFQCLWSAGEGGVTSGAYTWRGGCVSPCLLRLLIFLKQVPSHNLLSLCCLISSMISGWIFSLSSLQGETQRRVIGLRELS